LPEPDLVIRNDSNNANRHKMMRKLLRLLANYSPCKVSEIGHL
jgi:hypothetical protein